ncbi:MAG: hypothetical protein U9R38_02395 [Candidatus Margulisiibacteriota bacterium]|nr:hypothetical protein [Candidatus Margulisiibacteriota bacterium]
MDHFQGSVVDALNLQDARNQDLLDKVITAANEVSDNDAVADVVMDGDPETHEAGSIQWGGKEASLQGTGGVALLEFAKDAIQTAVSNISGIGTNQIKLVKTAMNKFNM